MLITVDAPLLVRKIFSCNSHLSTTNTLFRFAASFRPLVIYMFRFNARFLCCNNQRALIRLLAVIHVICVKLNLFTGNDTLFVINILSIKLGLSFSINGATVLNILFRIEFGIFATTYKAFIHNLTLAIDFHASSRCTNVPRIAYTKTLAVIH